MKRPLLSIVAAIALLPICLAMLGDAALAAPAPAAPAPAAPAPGTPTLTLDQAVQAALQNNPQIIAAQHAVTAAQQNVVVARAGYYPTISVGGSGGVGTESTSTTGITTTGVPVPLTTVQPTGTVSVVGNVPLFDSGITRANVATAQAALDNAQAALRLEQQTTALAAATAYFSVLQAERTTATDQALLKQAQAQLALTEAQVKAGVAARSDIIQFQAQVAQAVVNLLNATSQIATAKANLEAAIGIDVAAPVEVQDVPTPPLAVSTTAQSVISTAVSARPEVAQAAATVATDQAALALAQINAGPLVNIGVGAAYTPFSTNPILNNATSYGLTGTISLPVYNAGKGNAQIASAQATVRNGQALLANAKLTVQQNAYQSYLTAVADAQNVVATRAAQQAADEALRVAQGQYRAGVANIVAVITATTTATTADVNAVTALYSYESALATLLYAEGKAIATSALEGGQ
jgi:outer membrane protein